MPLHVSPLIFHAAAAGMVLFAAAAYADHDLVAPQPGWVEHARGPAVEPPTMR